MVKQIRKDVVDFKISDVVVFAGNAKHHPQHQIEQLKTNIKRYGYTQPILVTETGGLIAGHGRLQAVTEMGWDRIPAIVVEGLSNSEARALRISDNRISELGEVNEVALALELADLSQGLEYDLDGLGFMSEELGDLLADYIEDEEPPPEQEPPAPPPEQNTDTVVESAAQKPVPKDMGMGKRPKWEACPYRDECGYVHGED